VTLDLPERADLLRSLHVPGDPVVLPTVWDAWSARLAADQGFRGLTVGSQPVASAEGSEDGEGMSLDQMLARVAVVTAAVDIPVSADLESADSRGVHVVVNGRTDILLGAGETEPDRLDRAIERLAALADAGADSLYPVGRHDEATWQRMVAELPLPLNALAYPGKDDVDRFRRLGVGRISFGPMLQRVAETLLAPVLQPWAQPGG
jgi:2-methylisocitrate lyase-like PEP mutase family enzyme